MSASCSADFIPFNFCGSKLQSLTFELAKPTARMDESSDISAHSTLNKENGRYMFDIIGIMPRGQRGKVLRISDGGNLTILATTERFSFLAGIILKTRPPHYFSKSIALSLSSASSHVPRTGEIWRTKRLNPTGGVDNNCCHSQLISY